MSVRVALMLVLVGMVACAPRHRAPVQPSPGAAAPAPSSADVRAHEQPDNRQAEPVAEPAVRSLRGINVLPSHNEEMYPDDGPVPRVDHANVNLETTDGRAHSIQVTRLAVVLDHCANRARKDVSVRTVRGLELYTRKAIEPIETGQSRLTTRAGKPQELRLWIAFDSIETDSACAFAIDLVVDGHPVKLDLPMAIVVKKRLPE